MVTFSDKTGTLTNSQMAVARVAVVQSSKQGLLSFEVAGTLDVTKNPGLVFVDPLHSAPVHGQSQFGLGTNRPKPV